jgi:DNA-binding beta-propeller fold protein YncE
MMCSGSLMAGGCHTKDPTPSTGSVQQPVSEPPSFTAFESGQVRPLALSPNGNLLFAVNTPDNRLEIFRNLPNKIEPVTSVVVGLEPVAVAAPSNTEVWVVNHLSDSISVISLSQGADHPKVVRTLLVGDEPRDIVFAGDNGRRAFITTAHRGQNTGMDPQLTTPGVGRADVWVFDADNLGDAMGGTPLTVVTLFTDTPRALAVSTDGKRVYAAGFHTGNQTTSIAAENVHPTGTDHPELIDVPGAPPPHDNIQGVPAPKTALIVKFNGRHWVDERGDAVPWDDVVKLSLPDKDVFAIDATASPPVQVGGDAGFYAHVGTILFNMAVNPINGKLYVSNLEALNQVRFEGDGIHSGHRGVQGHLAESRITVIDPNGGTVSPRHLNKHIDYSTCCAAVPNDENSKSLAFPTEMAISSDGSTLYVAALGSSKLGVFSTSQLEEDSFVPNVANQIALSGGGPTGVLLDEQHNRLMVLTRFDNSISLVDTGSKTEVAHVGMFNPEPASITAGRRFLYDASATSSHGDSACASCHIFGDFDSLAWDLGNPDGTMLNNPGPFDNPPDLIGAVGGYHDFHPMKGPMTTQSLRGMANQGPMHWRGDRTGGNDEASVQPNSGSYNEHLGFMKFQVAFHGLLGNSGPIADADMSAFADFILQVTYPPNPLRNLDDSDTPDQADARAFFTTVPNSAFLTPKQVCSGCHALDPTANSQYGVFAPGFFGTDDNYSFVFINQLLKNPHLRNQYQKVGMFGKAPNPLVNPGNNDNQGDQVRGFGFFHDGTVDTEFRFVSIILFSDIPGVNDIGIPVDPSGDALRRKLESLMLAFPSNHKPAVGQQITLSPSTPASVANRIDFLESRAQAGDCELVAKARGAGGREVGYLFNGNGYSKDKAGSPNTSSADLRAAAQAPSSSVTFTCVPLGSGLRVGLDRDLDGTLDGDE